MLKNRGGWKGKKGMPCALLLGPGAGIGALHSLGAPGAEVHTVCSKWQ